MDIFSFARSNPVMYAIFLSWGESDLHELISLDLFGIDMFSLVDLEVIFDKQGEKVQPVNISSSIFSFFLSLFWFLIFKNFIPLAYIFFGVFSSIFSCNTGDVRESLEYIANADTDFTKL